MQRTPPILVGAWIALSAITTASAQTTGEVPPPTTATTKTQGQGEPDPQGPPPQQILVTARKQGPEAITEVPRSITAIDSRLIRDAGITSIKEAGRFVPNTLFTGFSARRLSFPFVRGVGSGQGDPAVATFVDEVPQLSISSTNLSLIGMDRIEVLRGPSGALWGRNTIGGSINLYTKKPSWRPEGEFSETFGNFSNQRFQVRATGPITDDTLAISVDASYESRDGYTDNTFTGNDVDSRASTFGRAQLLWAPDDNNTVRFTIYGEETRDGGFALAGLDDSPFGPGLRSNPFRINQDFEGSTERDILAGSMVWNHYGKNFDVVSITAVQGWEIDESADADFSSIDGVRRFTKEDEDYAYQEVRVTSVQDDDVNAGRKDGFKWLVGASGFYSDSHREAANEYRPQSGFLSPFLANGDFDRAAGDFESYAISVFGQASLKFANGWDASFALRYDYESRDADIDRSRLFQAQGVNSSGTTQKDRSFERFLPRFSLSHTDSKATTYVSAARGFKAGGFNLTAPTNQESFGTETSWTYEVGMKAKRLHDRVHANVALFFIDWDDMQLSQFDPLTQSGYVSNAGKSSSHGIEVELAGEVTDDWTVFGTAGYLETEFEKFTDSYGTNVKGNTLPFAPSSTFGAGSQYTHRFNDKTEGFFRVDWFHVGEFFYDAGNLGSESYHLTNLRLGWTRGNVRVEGFVANVFEEDYVSIAFQANPADPTQFVGANGAPRTYGLSVRVTF